MRSIRKSVTAVLCGVFCVLALSGCAKKSPALGTWTTATPLGTATVTLADGGTGTMSAPPLMNSAPITWQEKDNHVQIQTGTKHEGSPAPAAGGPSASMNIDGTLSADGKTMAVPIAGHPFTLNKQDAAK